MLTEKQLRLQIGDEAWDALPDRKPKRERTPRRRAPGNQARQRIILGGQVPAVVAAGFTPAEVSVLCVLAAEHKRWGRCTLTIADISRLACCCRTVVQNTLAWAARWGLISVKHRRVAYDRNLSNVVRIVSPVWIAWLRLGPSKPRPWGQGGYISVIGSPVTYNKEVAEHGVVAAHRPAAPSG